MKSLSRSSASVGAAPRAGGPCQAATSLLFAVTDGVSDAVLAYGADGVVRSCNPAAVELFGYHGDNIAGRRIESLLLGVRLPEDRHSNGGAAPPAQAVLRGCLCAAVRGDGTTFFAHLTVTRTAIDGDDMWIVVVDGVGADGNSRSAAEATKAELDQRVAELEDHQLRLEEQARDVIAMAEDLDCARRTAEESGARIKAVLDTVADAIVTIDGEGVIDSANPAVEGHFGYGADHIIGKPLAVLIPDLPADGAAFDAVPVSGEHDARHMTGGTFPVEVSFGEIRVGGRRRFTVVMRDIAERRKAEETIRQLALTDPLTGLPNRNLFHRRLDDALRMARRTDRHVALMLLDLDNFKSINDNFGHPVGDDLLMEIARLLTDATRDIDTVARLGGDEFAIIAPNLESTMTVDTIAVRIIQQLSRPMTLKGCLLNTGASIGISVCPRDDIDAEALIRMADQALYAAKTEGRGAYHYYDKAKHSAAMAQKRLEDDLRLALVREEFELYYQPQLRITGDRILGAEALVRWRHPARGLLAPGEFIPIAESSALIVELGEWVLRQSCKQNKVWQDTSMSPFRVAVNISARQFQSDDLAATVESVLEETGLDPQWLEIEITEGMMITDTETAATKLERIDDLGVQIAIDDFGTGYSSLAYLKSFPVKRLKVDQSFVRDLSTDADDAAIAEAVIRLGHSLNSPLIKWLFPALTPR